MKRAIVGGLLVVAGAGLLAAGFGLGSNRQKAAVGAAPISVPARQDAQAGKRILYYRNPMGLPDTSQTPKKDPMGMDYIPVYEGEETKGSEVRISPDKVQKLGVRTEPVVRRQLTSTVRAVGTVQVDERAMRTIAPRFEGWIERLHVNATGQAVARGQVLMEVYSPELVAAQQEYLVATRGMADLKDAAPEIQANMRTLAEGSLQRLRNLDIADAELARLRAEGTPRNSLQVRSPSGGVVLEKNAVQGMRFMPGEMLYRIADLGVVWLFAEVFEQDLEGLRVGQAARVRVSAYPGETFTGSITFIYPTVNPETRTARVRIELRNRDLRLKPDMYASVELAVSAPAQRLMVPDSAILDSGTRRMVLVQRGEGLFEPKEIKTGRRGDGYVEALEGVSEAEQVVVSANFLIDAESNLRSALNAFGHGAHGAKPAPTPAGAKPATHSAEGRVDSVDAKDGTATISHGPVPSLKWPAMTMQFRLTDPSALKLRPGDRIRFQFTEAAPGEWQVVESAPLSVRPKSPDSHKGH